MSTPNTTATRLPGTTNDGERAQRWLDAHGLPTGREEPWRYTPVADIGARLAEARPAVVTDVPTEFIDAAAGRHGATRIVVVNGVFVPELSDLDRLPAGVWLGSSIQLTDRVVEFLTSPADDPRDGFEALNRANAADVVCLQVGDDVQVDAPIQVVHVSSPSGERVLSNPRLVIDVGARAGVHLIESYVGSAAGAITNASTTLRLDTEAEATLHRMQHEPADAIHVGDLHVVQRNGARLRVLAVSRGASVARLGAHVMLAGEGATAELVGLSAPTTGARHDTVVTVDHAASRCTSDQRFRSVVEARARSSFSGHVIVRPGTVATDAHQRSDSLLLSPDAQSDSRPWLEIFADDVRCNHGSATGRLDADALFYLRSRGIPERTARQMLVEAFTRTITRQITPDTLRQQVEGWLRPEDDDR